MKFFREKTSPSAIGLSPALHFPADVLAIGLFIKAMLVSETEMSVRYAETDMMGIVYHGNYLPWFEVGRTNLMKELGMPYRELEAQGLYLPVLEVGVRYIKSARYDDRLTIVTSWKKRMPLM